MDLPTFHLLLTPSGQAALAAAAALGPTDAAFLRAFETLRKRHPPALAKAALETVLLREKARTKFALADRMYFTREALEQASGETVARYRAGRFAGFATVLDLCCGVGADSLALADAGHPVEAVDSDPLRLAMAAANPAACGVADRVRVTAGDVLTMPLPGSGAAFVDPSRRAGERRFLDPDQYQPPLGAVLARFPAGFPLVAKIAPGVARKDVERFDAEAEFVSVGGELKECVLWFGPLRTAARRATVLPGPHTLAAGDAPPELPPAEVGEYVFDPDAAVIRADLVGVLAGELGAVPVDHGVAVLTGAHAVRSPFADCYRVEHAAPFHAGRLRDYLRERRVGRVTPLKRAVDLDVNEVVRKLKLDGPGHRHLILTRSLGRTVAIVAEMAHND
jgi:SAM-dependent methyltransferase